MKNHITLLFLLFMTTNVQAAISYTKIANDGSVLPENATLGSKSTDWACTKDNDSGLVWEVKTNDGGLRDKNSYYSTDVVKGTDSLCKGSKCDVTAYTNAVNTQGLCGIKEWRMPTIEELKKLPLANSSVYFPDMPNKNGNANYFSSSVHDDYPNRLWYEDFKNGDTDWAERFSQIGVRLVGKASDLPVTEKPTPITPTIPTAPITTNVAPTVKLISGNATATIDTPYYLSLSASDKNNDLGAIYVDWGDGTDSLEGVTTNDSAVNFSHTYTIVGNYTLSFGAYDMNYLISEVISKSISVSKPAPNVSDTPPTLELITGNASIATGTSYSVKLKANIAGNNSAIVYINWGDGSSDSLYPKNNQPFEFLHTYSNANSYTWNVTAYNYSVDNNGKALLGAKSLIVSKSVTVSKPVPVVTQPVVNTPIATISPIIKTGSLLKAPSLLTPVDGVNLPLKKAAKFTWGKVTGATKYQIIFSTDSKFGNYDQAKNKCLNTTTCFTYVVNPTSYPLTASHNILKKDGSYFWIVQAISKTERSNSSDVRSFSVGTITPPAIESVSASPQEIGMGESVTLKAVLDRGLPANYSVQVSVDNGEFLPMSGSGSEFSLKISPTQTGEQYFQISIFDANGIEIDSSGDVFSVVAKTTATSGYTKIANDGSELSDNAVLGSKPKDWACTKDNKTGLIWEVKTDDGSLHDKNKTYTWDNSFQLVTDVNNQSLCGAKDWRMPTNEELRSLVFCSDFKKTMLGKEESGVICTGYPTSPTINTTYFPDIKDNYWFWSSTDDTYVSGYAWIVSFFRNGLSGVYLNNNYGGVRLVRG